MLLHLYSVVYQMVKGQLRLLFWNSAWAMKIVHTNVFVAETSFCRVHWAAHVA